MLFAVSLWAALASQFKHILGDRPLIWRILSFTYQPHPMEAKISQIELNWKETSRAAEIDRSLQDGKILLPFCSIFKGYSSKIE